MKTRKVIESLYEGRCTITKYQKIKKENKSTGFQEVVVHEDIACRLSFKAINSTNPSDTASAVAQTIKLFLAPEIDVKPGSKMTITQNGKTTDYKCSGQPAFYSSHQEVILELFEGWS